MDRHVILDNIELVLLTFDEVVDGGCVQSLAHCDYERSALTHFLCS